MPTPPTSEHPRRKPTVIIEINSDDDSGGGDSRARGKAGGGGRGRRLVKPDPADDVSINAESSGARERAAAAIPLRAKKPLSPPPRTRSPLPPPPRQPIAAAHPSGRPQPAFIEISDDDTPDDEEKEDSLSRGGSPHQKVLMIEGSGHGERRVVKEEPFDILGFDRARSAARRRAMVGDSAPGSSTAKRKRKREESHGRARHDARRGHRDGRAVPDARGGHRDRRDRPDVRRGRRDGRAMPDARRGHRDGRDRPGAREGHRDGRDRLDARGGHHSESSKSGASGTGRRATGIADEANSSRERSNGKSIEANRGGELSRSRLAKEALVSSEESWGAPRKAGRGESMTSGERWSGPPPVNLVGATVGSRIRSWSREQGRLQQASHSAQVVSDGSEEDGEEEEEEEEEQGRGHSASHSAQVVSDGIDEGGEEEQGRVHSASHSAPGMSDDTVEDGEKEEEEEQQGRVNHASHSVPVVSDDTEEDGEEKEKQQEQESEERGEEVAMELDDEGNRGENGVAQESEQEEYVVTENREDDNGDSNNEEDQAAAAAAAAPDDDDEGKQEGHGEKDLVEGEVGSEEESHSIYEGDEEDGAEESEEDGVEIDEAGEEQSDAITCGSARSGGDGTRTFRKRIFEGICLPEKPDKTADQGIVWRTRSKRKCSDPKLLRRGFYSKPVQIDVLDLSSESEEDVPTPAQPLQGLLSSSEDNSSQVRRKRRRENRKLKKKASTSSDEYEVKKPRKAGEGSRRLKNGASNGQAAKEGGKNLDGSNPDRAKYNGPNGGHMSNAQDDLSFKKHANPAHMRKHCQGSRAKAEYDELLNSLFAGWENHTDGAVPADSHGGNSLPLVFSFGDDEEVDDKSENDKFQDELWREFDVAIESTNSHGCEEEDTCHGPKVPPGEAASCKNGNHEFIIDEQIGVRCKHCNVVELEIRYVLPSMGKFSTERDSTTGPELDSVFKEMLTLFEKNDLLVANGNEIAYSLGARRAGSVWDLIPGVKEDMFVHQQDAFEFVWRKLAGSTEIEKLRSTANTDTGGGCVISHAPGTGKTRLAITFVQSYLEVFPRCCPVIIAPRAMLATWEKEFKKWKVKLPFHVLNSTEMNCTGDKTIQARIEKDGPFARRILTNKVDQNYRRLVKLTSWCNGTSIIGVSYSLFRKLANDEGMDGDDVRKLLLERPDLLVLDEGHTPRNKKSLIWKVLAKVRTEKRIFLSGTLFQNNFEELYNTLYLVRPKDAMLLEKDEGKDWTSLRLSNITEENIENIRTKLEPVVHYHKGNFLEKSLPGLKETVVILNPLPRQKEIISIMENASMGTLDAEYKISLALVHPSLITCAKLSEKEASLVDNTLLKSLRSNPCEGVKTRFVVEVIHQCQVLNERVLVFSQYLEPLSLIMEQLKKRFNWTEDKEILQMSGNVRVKQREAMMAAFNDMRSEAKVMLASTKACCEGITLVGASRVVLLDVVWNPSVGRQAIGRAYRIGQKKIVYTYNLIADGTKEMEKYSRQAKKEHMSKMLFSNEEQSDGCNISPESTFSDRVLEAMTACEDLKDLFVAIRIENQTDGSIR